jgi:uncharacterized RDD family membrane protein YckC
MEDTLSPSVETANPYAPPVSQNAVQNSAPSLPPDLPLETVRFWRRASARLLDIGVHMVIGLFAGIAIGIVVVLIAKFRGVPFQTLNAQIQPAFWIAFLASLAGGILFMTITEGWHGCSPGKLLLGIVVLQEAGRPCTPRQALHRNLAYLIDALFFGAVAAVNMSESPLNQRLGDKWAGTVVVYRRSAPPRSLRSGLRFVTVGLLASLASTAVVALPYLLRLLAL